MPVIRRLVVLICTGLALVQVAPASGSASAPPTVEVAAAIQEGPDYRDPTRLRKALRAWLNLYQRGRFDLAAGEFLGDSSIAARSGVLPPSQLGQLTYVGEITLLCDAIADVGGTEGLELLLEVAAVGTEGIEYEASHQPYKVRRIAEDALGKVESNGYMEHARKLASGEAQPAARALAVPVRAAAIRALGRFDQRSLRPTIHTQLTASETLLRWAAAEALADLADVASLEPLAKALHEETHDRVLFALAGACRVILEPFAETPDAIPDAGRQVIEAAIHALGRGTWRSDVALIELLETFRHKATVPALIAVLERFRDHPDLVRDGTLSGLLQHRAHELLVSLTGAMLPMDQPDKWREFWKREQDKFALATRPPEVDSGTAAKGFFGIPVRGTRITFILDVSGSMEWGMPRRSAGTTASSDTGRRIDAAKAELIRAVDGLPEIASFNLVVFGDVVKTWQKDMVPANKGVKERFRKYVASLRPTGGTNLYGGLQAALKMKSLVWNDRYETHVDEIFLLSDGAPSVGEVTDPERILQLVKGANQSSRVRINTVFISGSGAGRGGGPAGGPGGGPGPGNAKRGMTAAGFMARLAEENGGRAVDLR